MEMTQGRKLCSHLTTCVSHLDDYCYKPPTSLCSKLYLISEYKGSSTYLQKSRIGA